jgi:DNA-binding beta-propeller fold protein YncE
MRRWPRNLAIVVAVLVAAAVSSFWAVRGVQRSPGGGSPVVARIALHDSPRQAVLAADGLWVVGERALYRIDPSSNRVVATIPVGTVLAAPAAVAMDGGAAWMPAVTSTTLWRVDRTAERVAGRVRLDRTLLGPVGWPHGTAPSG